MTIAARQTAKRQRNEGTTLLPYKVIFPSFATRFATLGGEPPRASGLARVRSRHFPSGRLPRRCHLPARSIATSPLWLKTVICGLFLRCFAPPRRAPRGKALAVIPEGKGVGGYPTWGKGVSGYSQITLLLRFFLDLQSVAGSGTQPQGGEPPRASAYFRVFLTLVTSQIRIFDRGESPHGGFFAYFFLRLKKVEPTFASFGKEELSVSGLRVSSPKRRRRLYG